MNPVFAKVLDTPEARAKICWTDKNRRTRQLVPISIYLEACKTRKDCIHILWEGQGKPEDMPVRPKMPVQPECGQIPEYQDRVLNMVATLVVARLSGLLSGIDPKVVVYHRNQKVTYTPFFSGELTEDEMNWLCAKIYAISAQDQSKQYGQLITCPTKFGKLEYVCEAPEGAFQDIHCCESSVIELVNTTELN